LGEDGQSVWPAGRPFLCSALVSGTVKDLTAGAGLRFEPHGVHVLKAVSGEWALYRATEG
jgi:hypothetical protein